MAKVQKGNRATEWLMYKSANGSVRFEVYIQDETLWLTQEKISILFGVQRPAITKHLKNVFESGELNEHSVSSILEHTASDGKTYKTKFYNLDAIISVGYRVIRKKMDLVKMIAKSSAFGKPNNILNLTLTN